MKSAKAIEAKLLSTLINSHKELISIVPLLLQKCPLAVFSGSKSMANQLKYADWLTRARPAPLLRLTLSTYFNKELREGKVMKLPIYHLRKLNTSDSKEVAKAS